MLGLCVGDREARADGHRGELIDSVAAGTSVRKLLLIEALGHARRQCTHDLLQGPARRQRMKPNSPELRYASKSVVKG